MKNFFKDWDVSEKGMLWGVPEELAALALITLAEKQNQRVVHVALDDAGMERMRRALIFFGAPENSITTFPAWDCLPYDRISPSAVLVGRRLRCLTELQDSKNLRYVLTTVNAWLQKVPPKNYLSESSKELKIGERISQNDLTSIFVANAYQRVETVRETGEFAIRGSIIDLFPSGHDGGIRIDFFDNEIETIKRFDPETQRSTGKIKKLRLYPVSEVTLTEEKITYFRQRYLEVFGAESKKDPLYQSVSEGRITAGMEHLLPLFYEELETFSDYLGEVAIVFSAEIEAATTERLNQIEDFSIARIEAASESQQDTIWRSLRSDALYMTKQDWEEASKNQHTHHLSPFAKPDASMEKGFDLGAKRGEVYYQSSDAQHSPSKAVAEAIPKYLKENKAILLTAMSEGTRMRIEELIAEHLSQSITAISEFSALRKGKIYSAVLPIENGVKLPDLVIITEKDIYGERIARPSGRRKRRADNFLREVSSLQAGDLVVHVEHGIGRYEGLEKIITSQVAHDCLLLSYAGGDRLFLPVENIDLLSRYGSDSADASLDKLGGVAWQARKSRIKNKIREIASQLIKVAAGRKTTQAEPIIPDSGAYAEFCQRFPYAETEDQLETIADVMGDLASGRVMDRLICGDVGFGKTEVALRAAFAVAMAGYQVAVVTPTTLLARQHGQVFTERFRGFPIKIDILSRMTASGAAKSLKQDIASGACQIIIGTHALLSKSLNYNHLGLIIVDEEQHFGVAQKERLKTLRSDIHVLTLSATPIPRTLQMALSGVRDMSLIATPPVDRLAVRTSVSVWDSVVLAEAIRRERFRGGQVFCVCPRIEQMPSVYDRLLRLVAESRIITAHGQMKPQELDEAMTVFGQGGGDVLLCTNIIESGIDIPTANTIIIHRADMFGLSQLYQLRGRVGRGKQRAYAYLTTDPHRLLSANARKRLEVMQTLDSLGAGFNLASYDLDIRGAGNLLGDEQSGHVKEVGVELYQEMLSEAVKVANLSEASHDREEESWSPTINLGAAVLIPDSYVADLTVRLSLYRRIASLQHEAEIDELIAELIDRFGAIPDEVRNLFDTISIKLLCKAAHIAKVDAGPKGLSLSFRNNKFPKPENLIGYIASSAGKWQLTSDHRLVAKQILPLSTRPKATKKVLEEIAALAI